MNEMHDEWKMCLVNGGTVGGKKKNVNGLALVRVNCLM